MVTIRGKVIDQITGDAAEEHIDKLARKYIDLDKFPRRSKGERRVILKIKPERIFHIILCCYECARLKSLYSILDIV